MIDPLKYQASLNRTGELTNELYNSIKEMVDVTESSGVNPYSEEEYLMMLIGSVSAGLIQRANQEVMARITEQLLKYGNRERTPLGHSNNSAFNQESGEASQGI